LEKKFMMPKPLLGVDYYPEHWPPERWRIDARMMREIGLSVVRLAEFAWTKMEPEEGKYTWGWLDDAVEALAAEGLQIVLGTPTATPPAWLIQKHPDILPVNAQGRRCHAGSRRHYCSNHPAYQQHTRRIVTEMAKRYTPHPALTGWQIDNEVGNEHTARCYCEYCVAAFRNWLQRKYASLEALNLAWGTVFWSQLYSDWAQITTPNLTLVNPNPSQALDWYRFSSDSVAAYAQIQMDILRPICPHQFITMNFISTLSDFDHYKISGPLDFISWDNYPTGYAEVIAPGLYGPDEPRPAVAYDAGDPYVTGFCHDLMRGLKADKPFWIMEQQAGHINWAQTNPGIRPGNVRLWTWHDLAAGADTVVYFRWRACRFAQEQYHSGLLRHDAAPDLGYREVLRMKAEQPLMRNLQGARVQVEAAILADYDDLWATDLQPHNQVCTYWRHLFGYYRALAHAGVSVDILSTQTDLTPYKLVIAPNLLLADEALAAHLAAYVEGGGTLVLGARSGFKTPSNLVTDQPLPGPFRALAGATVEAFHSLPPGIAYPIAAFADQAVQATTWVEGLSLQSALALATYTGGPLAGQAAVTLNRVGQGRAVYAGLWPNPAVAEALIGWLLPQAEVRPAAGVPEGVLVLQRGPFLFLLNFTDAAATVRLNIAPAADAFTGQAMDQEVSVLARDVRILKM
jgi:beta-galactosidase